MFCTSKQAWLFNQILSPTDSGQRREKDGKTEEAGWREANGFYHAVLSTNFHLACLLNQTAWLVLVLWVLTPSLQHRNPRALWVSCLSGWRPGRFTPRRHIGRDARGGGGEGEKAQERRTEGRLAGRRQRERHWTLPSWDWFTSLTEITSLTYKPEVKISH